MGKIRKTLGRFYCAPSKKLEQVRRAAKRFLYLEKKWAPPEPPNRPAGVPKGIFPGRVTWAHDASAAKWDGTGNWYDARNDQEAIDAMVARSLSSLSGENTGVLAWQAIFRYFNGQKNKSGKQFQAGEKVAVKINCVNSIRGSDFGINTTPELLRSVCGQLVNEAGVRESDITIYDVGVGNIPEYVKSYCSDAFADIAWKETGEESFVDAIRYSGSKTDPGGIARTAHDADYIVNIANLKAHGRETGVTLCGKNHVGSIGRPESIHKHISRKSGAYDARVDLMGHNHLGGKTLLYIIDGLYGAPEAVGREAVPLRWITAPFDNHWPSSVFMSLDGVAIDSVGLDFIRGEWPERMWRATDNYLHEAAKADNPPSNIFYDPEGTGERLCSLGVHEHWNNSVEKKYSGNLGSKNGIELFSVNDI